MSTVIKAAIAIGLAVVLLIVVGKCRDGNASVANAVAKERVRVADSVTKAFEPVVERLRDSVKVRVDTVRFRTTRWDTVTQRHVDTVFARDSTGEIISAVPLPQYEAVVAAGDSLKRACTLLAQSCEQLRDSVPKLVDLLHRASAARDSLIVHPKPARRWSLCAAGGYGGALSGGGVRTGPSATVGVCYRLW